MGNLRFQLVGRRIQLEVGKMGRRTPSSFESRTLYLDTATVSLGCRRCCSLCQTLHRWVKHSRSSLHASVRRLLLNCAEPRQGSVCIPRSEAGSRRQQAGYNRRIKRNVCICKNHAKQLACKSILWHEDCNISKNHAKQLACKSILWHEDCNKCKNHANTHIHAKKKGTRRFPFIKRTGRLVRSCNGIEPFA